jgi:hypothetical protein
MGRRRKERKLSLSALAKTTCPTDAEIFVTPCAALPGSFAGSRAGTLVCALPDFVRLICRVICESKFSPPEQEGTER